MYSLTLLHNGQPITPHDIHDYHDRIAVETELNLVYEAVSHVVCPVHNMGLQLSGLVQDQGKLTFVAHSCCGTIKELAQDHLAHLPVEWK